MAGQKLSKKLYQQLGALILGALFLIAPAGEHLDLHPPDETVQAQQVVEDANRTYDLDLPTFIPSATVTRLEEAARLASTAAEFHVRDTPASSQHDAIYAWLVYHTLYIADPRKKVVQPVLGRLSESGALTFEHSSLKGETVTVINESLSGSNQIDEESTIAIEIPGSVVLAQAGDKRVYPLVNHDFRSAFGNSKLVSYLDFGSNILVPAGKPQLLDAVHLSATTPVDASFRVLSLTNEPFVNLKLKSLSEKAVQPVSYTVDAVNEALKQLRGKTVIAFGHVEPNDAGDFDVVIYPGSNRQASPILKISYGSLIAEAQRQQVDLHFYGCDTARPSHAGTIGRIDPEIAVEALIQAMTTARSSLEFYQMLGTQSNIKLVFMPAPGIGDSADTFAIAYYLKDNRAGPPNAVLLNGPGFGPAPLDFNDVLADIIQFIGFYWWVAILALLVALYLAFVIWAR
jgi:hypothetical protein